MTLFDRLIGIWTTEATHPTLPGVVAHGAVEIEWVEDKRFLIHRSRSDNPGFPNSISIICSKSGHSGEAAELASSQGGLSMRYFDERGIFLTYDTSVDETTWRWWRENTSFPQRCICTLSADGNTIKGFSQIRENDDRWVDDFAITYRRLTQLPHHARSGVPT